MREKIIFWLTFVLAIIGALSWTPTLFNIFKPVEITGKMISRYTNLTENKDTTMIIYKLAIVALNKPFNLETVECEIEDVNGNKLKAQARNNRITVFNHEGKFYKLAVSGSEMINNIAQLPVNESKAGYLIFHFSGNLDTKWEKTTFRFRSFLGLVKEIIFKEDDIKSEQLFFDETIWQQLIKEEFEEIYSKYNK